MLGVVAYRGIDSLGGKNTLRFYHRLRPGHRASVCNFPWNGYTAAVLDIRPSIMHLPDPFRSSPETQKSCRQWSYGGAGQRFLSWQPDIAVSVAVQLVIGGMVTSMSA